MRQHLQLSQARRHLSGQDDQPVLQLLQGKQLQLMQLFRGDPTNLQSSKAGFRTLCTYITPPMAACPAGKRAMSHSQSLVSVRQLCLRENVNEIQ